ncbi:hypothetical protein FB45DRAFT_933776 [Roridomyces roridus]|uniref:F-box domain-containing protein n=1 Tax=Roridomyces roridus TaxID=1738132 RepID=A0AAD7BCN2_9AGAR|nr:hypothetical protein FB45DRAFT_933776 [Roridomyces roridus]
MTSIDIRAYLTLIGLLFACPTMSLLFSLPTELLLAVIDAMDSDSDSLRHFAVTCKLACLLTEPILYRTLLVTSGSEASRLAQALQQHRADFVQSLDLRPQYRGEEGIEDFTPTISVMTHLRSLSVESPFANYGRWHHSESRWEVITGAFRALFQSAQSGVGLQSLESLEIHWTGDGSELWMLTEFKPILALPALRSLTISSAAIVAEDWGVNEGTTALHHLELIECFVTGRGLYAVLSLPRALRSCHLGQLRHTRRDVENARGHEEASPKEQLDALRSQRHALQSLVWKDAGFSHSSDGVPYVAMSTSGSPGLSDFTELHTLTLDGHCAFFLSLLLSDRAPPNLHRLRLVWHDNGVIFDVLPAHGGSTSIPNIPHPEALLRYLPTLRHLDVVLSPVGSSSLSALWENEARRDRVRQLSGELRARGVQFCVYMAWRGPGLVPPYLFGEYVPVEKSVYEYRGEVDWFGDAVSVRVPRTRAPAGVEQDSDSEWEDDSQSEEDSE